TSGTPPTAAQLQACQTALVAVGSAQTTTGTAQTAVGTAAQALDKAVGALQKAVTASAGTSGSGTSGPSAGTSSTGSSTRPSSGTGSSTAGTSGSSSAARTSGGGSGAGTTTVASAADILSDRAAIDSAQSRLDIADQNLSLVTLTSPIAGTVAAVSLSVGSSVSAQSTSAVVTVVGTDGFVVSTTVPLGSIDAVKVGQKVAITVPSTTATLAGTVSSIGVLDVSSTSTPAYAVTVAVSPTTEKLYGGSSAQLVITVAGTDQVLTVPTSAVHVDGQTATVQVLDNGVARTVTVQRGAVGSELTQITSGLTEGQKVVLADLSVPMVSSTRSSSSTGLLSGGNGGANRQFGGTFNGPPAGGVRPGG
ncbi:MAG: hypothetical protein B7X40_01450, partial [Cellulomonas sp. 14-74-6]